MCWAQPSRSVKTTSPIVRTNGHALKAREAWWFGRGHGALAGCWRCPRAFGDRLLKRYVVATPDIRTEVRGVLILGHRRGSVCQIQVTDVDGS